MGGVTGAFIYEVFGLPGKGGGKRAAVFLDGAGDLQARAAASGAPLNVFVLSADVCRVQVRVFTPTREKGESESASIAALEALHAQGLDVDLAEVITGGSDSNATSLAAQRCSTGEWLLEQGVVQVQALPEAQVHLKGLKLPRGLAIHRAFTLRPNLVLEVPDVAALDAFDPDAEAIAALNRATDTTGLVLYALDAPGAGPQRRADVSVRCFGPLKGFLEDAASSNMCACLTGVLNERELLQDHEHVIRVAQRKPGQFALLSAHFGLVHEVVWVGGWARPAELG